MKSLIGSSFFVSALILFLVSNSAMAGWKEDQAAIFQKVQVKPGDKIDASNWQKVKDILPESVLTWVKKGDFIIDVAELEWDFNNDAAWRDATAKNAGKYKIGPDDEIIEKATGKAPIYVNGEPFPSFEFTQDSKAGTKIAFNAIAGAFRSGTVNISWVTDWIGRKGLERTIIGSTLLRYYWGVPDGPIPNQGKFLQNEVVKVKEPYDVSGIVSLAQRTIANTPDQVYSYVPAIRRVKKVSGTTRSSPFLGTDFVSDDTNGFYGKIESMEWKAIDQKIILLPLPKWAVKGPAKFSKQADGSWTSPTDLISTRNGLDVRDWKGAPWAPVDFAWVPRLMYVVSAQAKDPFYNYGETIYYIDPVAGFTYKVINDRSGSYWKTLIVSKIPAEWDNKTTVCSAAWYVAVDDKADHASICNVFGKYRNYYSKKIYNDPNLSESIYSPTAMQALSK